MWGTGLFQNLVAGFENHSGRGLGADFFREGHLTRLAHMTTCIQRWNARCAAVLVATGIFDQTASFAFNADDFSRRRGVWIRPSCHHFLRVVTMKRVVATRLPALIDVSNRPPLRAELWKTQTMQWVFLSAVLAMGIVVAAVSGYFVFQDEG